jgi:hypothetical protein
MYRATGQQEKLRRPVEVTYTRRGHFVRALHVVATFNAADPASDRDYIAHGTYDNEQEAIRVAEHLIEEQLLAAMASGRSPERAFHEWAECGEIPITIALRADARRADFDSLSYAFAWTQRRIGRIDQHEQADRSIRSPANALEL